MANDRARYGPGSGVVFGKTDMRRERRRRKEEQITIIDWLLTAGILLLLLAIGAMIGYAARDNGDTMRHRVPIIQPSEAEKRWLNERFKFHGIWACIEENGERYFYRDGKKCKL